MKLSQRLWRYVASGSMFLYQKTFWHWLWKLNGKACYEIER